MVTIACQARKQPQSAVMSVSHTTCVYDLQILYHGKQVKTVHYCATYMDASLMFDHGINAEY